MSIIWSPLAQADLKRLCQFLNEKNADAADRALDTIIFGADQLIGFPKVGLSMSDGTERRELFVPFGGGGYVLRYRLAHGNVVVIRVWHSREAR